MFRVLRSIFRVFEWLGGHGAMVLSAALVVVLATWLFIELADAVQAGRTDVVDRWAVQYIKDHPGPMWMRAVGRDLTSLGSVPVVLVVTLIVVGYLFIQRKFGALWLVVIASIGGLALAGLLQYWVNRARPFLLPHQDLAYSPSFPSGHSMISAVVYLTLGSMLAHVERDRLVKWYFLFVALGLTFIVGVSRVYMGVHWPTDVLAGWAAGLVWALLLWLVTRYLQLRGAVEPGTEDSGEAHPVRDTRSATR